MLRMFPTLCPVQEQLKLAETAGGHPYVDDPDLGARPQPLLRDTVRTLDYRYVLTLDSLGFPNREPWPDDPDVAVLGNSLAAGPGVGIRGQFSTLLARALGETSVVNLALPGGSPAQELGMYTKFLQRARPRVVIVAVWVASDVDNAVEFTQWLRDGSPPHFTTYRLTFGSTHAGFAPLNAVRDQLSSSYLLRAVYYGIRRLGRDHDVRETVAFSDGQQIYLSVRAQHRLAAGAARPGFDLDTDFVAPLVRLREAVESDGGEFLVALLPSKEEIYGAASYPAVLHTVRDVRTAMDAAGLPVLDLYPLFRERGQWRAPFYARDIHFTAYGNQLVANALSRWVLDHVPVPTATRGAVAGGRAPGAAAARAPGRANHGA